MVWYRFCQTNPSSTFTFRSSFQIICYQTGSLSKIWTGFFMMAININRPFPFAITVKQRKTEEVLTTYVTKFSTVVGEFPVFSMLGKWTFKSPVVVFGKLEIWSQRKHFMFLLCICLHECSYYYFYYLFISVQFYRVNKSSERILINSPQMDHKWSKLITGSIFQQLCNYIIDLHITCIWMVQNIQHHVKDLAFS